MTPVALEPWLGELAMLVESRIGIRLRVEQPQSAIAPFVRARTRELGLSSPTEYIRMIASESADGEEFSRLTVVCTNGQTSFFRDAEQIKVITDFAASLAAQVLRPLNIWSAGCSTGDEPYTLAISFLERGVDARILATDVNPENLELARNCTYHGWSLRNLSDEQRECYFEEKGSSFRLRDRVRRNVTLERHNLVTQEMPRPKSMQADSRWDVILCRNVFIYHSRLTVQTVVSRMAEVLCREGCLFLSASESLSDIQVPLHPVTLGARFAYSNTPKARSLASSPPGPATAAGEIEHAIATSLVHDIAPLADELGTLGAKVDIDPSGPSWPPHAATPRAGDASGSRDHDSRALARAVAGISRSDFASARRLLEDLVSQESDNVIARLTLGHVYLQAHDFDLALDAYSEAQANAPLLPEVHYFQGVVHRKVGNMEQAELALRRALFLEPTFWPAAFLLAGTYERRGHPELGRREIRNTMQLIESDRRLPFQSHTLGIGVLHMDPDQVLAVCRQRTSGASASSAALASTGGPTAGQQGASGMRMAVSPRHPAADSEIDAAPSPATSVGDGANTDEMISDIDYKTSSNEASGSSYEHGEAMRFASTKRHL